jgi:hypothetical protein
MTCSECSSTWRVRATALALLTGLGFPPSPFPEISADWSRRGIGLSDHVALAAAISSRFDYTNTYLHRYPRFDLLDVTDDLMGELEFVICSDVLEHVPPPEDSGARGLAQVLCPGGFAVLSVPTSNADETLEFYPGLVSWTVESDHSISWVDATGQTHIDHNPEYHGGPGQTLAFRLFSARSFARALTAAGFSRVEPVPVAEHLGVPAIDSAGVFIAFR